MQLTEAEIEDALMRKAAVPPKVGRWRRQFGWPKTLAFGILLVLIAMPVLGLVYQAVATERDRSVLPAPGRLVDVDGSRLHVFCIGEGSPTVLLESAFPGTSADWAWVQPGVSETTRVCAYDRAGMGWSESGPLPRDAQRIATELHSLLNRADIPAPYVLVGHSLGGLFTRMYAAQYPDEVAGLILVDATHPDVQTRLPPELAAGFSPGEQMLTLLPILAAIGVTRSGLVPVFPVDPDLPAPERTQVKALNASTRAMATIANELRSIPSSAEQVRAVGSLGNRPLAVLTAEDTFSQAEGALKARANRAWKEMQAELAGLSTNRTHRQVEGATHESLVYREQDATVTIATIREVIDAVRAGSSLVMPR
jgi:pimeloyl-ACP methyl ester carboxylesterase